MEFFQLRGNVRVFRGPVATLQSEFWTNCNLLNSKSVSDKNNELQWSSLLLTKAFAKRTDVLRSRRGQIL